MTQRARGFQHGDPRARAAGQRGGAITGAQRQRDSITLWITRYPEITPEAAREIYQAGYASGWNKGAADRRRKERGE